MKSKVSKANAKLKAASKALGNRVIWRCRACKATGPKGDFKRIGGNPRCPECNDLEVGPAEVSVPLMKALKSLSVGEVNADDECPNCHNGTVEDNGEELVCRGECGAVLRRKPKKASGGRRASEVVEEWSGVAGWNDSSALSLLTRFIDEMGQAAVLDDFLREKAQAEVGSDTDD